MPNLSFHSLKPKVSQAESLGFVGTLMVNGLQRGKRQKRKRKIFTLCQTLQKGRAWAGCSLGEGVGRQLLSWEGFGSLLLLTCINCLDVVQDFDNIDKIKRVLLAVYAHNAYLCTRKRERG